MKLLAGRRSPQWAFMERQAEILAGWVRALADHQPDTKETE